jgi:hypothetical protein
VLTTVPFRPETAHAGQTPVSQEHAGALLLPWPGRRCTAARRLSAAYREQANVRTDGTRLCSRRVVQASHDHALSCKFQSTGSIRLHHGRRHGRIALSKHPGSLLPTVVDWRRSTLPASATASTQAMGCGQAMSGRLPIACHPTWALKTARIRLSCLHDRGSTSAWSDPFKRR